MIRLLHFELDKIWRKPSFLLSVAVLIILNVFLLWYTNLSDSETPPLSSYKAVQRDMEKLTESEKKKFIELLYDDIKGANVVNNVLNYRNFADENMGKAMEKKAKAENPGIFEKYYEKFISGNYLKYTDSLQQETALITEIYDEARRVFHYGNYLADIEKRKNTLQGISIFSSEGGKSFSARNLKKEAADYEALSSIRTEFSPSKGITSADSPEMTDLLLLLSVFLFASALIYEEKEKKLFLITRSTPAGRTKNISAKLAALAIHCFTVTTLFYGVNLAFFATTTGVGSLFRSLQSISSYMGSNLQISVLTYLALGLITKTIVFFVIGAVLVSVAILSKQSFLPYLAGTVLMGSSMLLYLLVPASAAVNWLKYLNPIGLLHTEELYGAYLNFNLFGHPVSRLHLSWFILILYSLCATIFAVRAFVQSRNLEVSRIELPAFSHFKPHVNLYRHEGYKILIMNRALVVLLTFTLLFGYQHLTKTYTLTPTETYYQNMMMDLAGELTPEKTSLIEKENNRYENAFEKISQIEEMVSKGEVSEQEGENMKSPYYSETAFYPAFQKVLNQYDYVKETGGKFVYDTGYVLLLGLADNNRLQDFILLTACIIFSFSAVFSMEYREKSWYLLGSTVAGRKKVYRSKVILCMVTILPVFLLGWLCQVLQVVQSCPLNQITASSMALPQCREIGVDVPIIVFILLMVLLQLLTLVCVLLVTLVLSQWLKNHLLALFTSVLLLIVPVVLNAMGLSFAKWASLFPLFDGTASCLEDQGINVCLGYLIATAILIIGCSLALRKASTKSN